MNLKEAVNNINFDDVKNYKPVKLKVKNSNWLDSVEFEYCDAPTIYDKEGFTYCLNLKRMPFHSWPMRNSSYIQTYKSIKRMLNKLFKEINPDVEVEDLKMVKVEVDVIRKTTFEFVVEAVLDSDGDIDIEKTKEKAYEAYCKAKENNTLHNYFGDEDLSYEIGDEI